MHTPLQALLLFIKQRHLFSLLPALLSILLLVSSPGRILAQDALRNQPAIPNAVNTVRKAAQTITFTTLPAKVYGDADFAASASSSSGLQVSYTSSNTAVATIIHDRIHVVGPGETVITAFQPGDAYTLPTGSNPSQSLTVAPAPITVTASPMTKVYGDLDPVFGYTITSGALMEGDTFSGKLERADAGTNDLQKSTRVGTYAIGIGSLDPGTKYQVTFVGNDLTVTKRPLIIAPIARSKVYGDADPNFPYMQNGTSYASTDGMTGTFGRTAGEDAGTYALSIGTKRPISLTTYEDMSANYDITFISNTLTITKRPLIFHPLERTKEYGSIDPEFPFSLDGTSLAPDDSTIGFFGRSAGENVGSYAFTIGTMQPQNSSTGVSTAHNYDITFISNTFSITPKPIDVTANDVTKEFGDADPVFSYSAPTEGTDLTFTGSLSRAPGETTGVYAISKGSLVTSNANYTVNVIAGSLTVSPKNLTITPNAATKVYGNADPAFSFSTSVPIVGNAAFEGSLGRAAGEPVGSYALNLGSLSLDNPNYNLVLSDNPANLSITKRPFTIRPVVRTKIYGDADPYLNAYSTEGKTLAPWDASTGAFGRPAGEDVGNYQMTLGEKRLVNTNTFASADANYDITFISSTFSITPKPIDVIANAATKEFGDPDPIYSYSAATETTGVTYTGSVSRAPGETLGVYAITKGSLASSNANYTVNAVTGSLTITPKNLIITPNAATKIYGNADPELTFSTNVSIVGNAAFTGALSRAEGRNVGNYAISQGDLALDNANYTLSFASGGDLTITKRPMTLHPVPATKIYGNADPGFPYRILNGTVAPGEGMTGVFGRAAGENVGTYALTLGTKQPVDVTTGAYTLGNYEISFISDNLTITPKQLEVTALNVSKEFGDSDPLLSYSLNPALVEGDTATGSVERTAGEQRGTYTVNQGTLSFGNNYAPIFNSGTFTIEKKTITVSAIASSKIFGSADPALTYTTSFSPADESFTGTLSREPGENIGGYRILQGTLALSDNYLLNFGGADFQIDKKVVQVIANAKSKSYGSADPALDYSAEPLVGTDNFLGSLSRVSGENAGTYAIQQGSLMLPDNYQLVYTGADLRIGKLSLTYVADTVSRFLMTENPVFTGTVTGFLPGEDLANVTTGTLLFSSPASAGSALGKYAINGSGLSAMNYDFVQDPANSTALTIVASTDNRLAALSLSPGSMSPAFSALDTVYSMNVTNEVRSVDFSATANNIFATLSVQGTEYISGTTRTLPLNSGPNPFEIIVTAQDGSIRRYRITVNRDYSSNNLLSSLVIPGVTLVPVFDPNVLIYRASVAHSTDKIDLYGIAADSTARVEGNNGLPNTATNPFTQNLSVGEYAYHFSVTSESGTARTYQLIITRAASPDATLAAFGNELVTYNAPITAGSYNYTGTVSHETAAARFNPVPNAAGAGIRVLANGQQVGNFGGYLLPFGFNSNVLTVEVTSPDSSTTHTYTLTVVRAQSANAQLGSLRIPFQTSLNESFDPAVYAYTANLSDSTITGLPLTAYAASEFATVKINGTLVPRFENYDMALQGGPNTFRIVVTSQDSTDTKTYTLVLNRAGQAPPTLSPVAALASVTLYSGSSFSRNFNLANEELTPVTVANNVASVGMLLNKEHPGSTLTLNGASYDVNLNESDLHPLVVGDNLFSVVVTAEDRVSTKTYSILIRRLPFVNLDLASLTLDKGILSPAFSAGTISYSALVAEAVTTLHVKPVATLAGNTITVNGIAVEAANPIAAIQFNGNSPNRIRIVVKGADGVSTKTYTLNVFKGSTVATTQLNIRPATKMSLTTGPGFQNFVTTVGINTPSIQVRPMLADTNATVSIDGNPVPGGEFTTVPLNSDLTLITVVVTAQNGFSTKTYTLQVRRAKSNVATASFSVSPGTALTSIAGTGIENYLTSVTIGQATIDVKPVLTQKYASLSINGAAAVSGESTTVPLSGDSTLISILVTAENGVNTNTYTIKVKRTGLDNATASLNIRPASTLVATSGTGFKNYMTSVSFAASSIEVKPILADSNATVSLNGVPAASGSFSAVPLSGDSTLINMLVTAENGVTTKNYTLLVKREGRDVATATLNIRPATKIYLTTGAGFKNFTTTVNAGSTSIQVRPVLTDSNATVRINGAPVQGNAFSTVPLSGQETLINVLVTAQNGITTKLYTLLVKRKTASIMMASEEEIAVKTLPAGALDQTGKGLTEAAKLFVHQGLSPNGDGMNDYLEIDAIGQFPDNTLSVINSKGILVYQTKGYGVNGKVFDGHSSNGSLLVQGTYYYILEYKDGKVKNRKTGYIILKY